MIYLLILQILQSYLTFVTCSITAAGVRFVIGSTSRHWISRTASRLRLLRATIKTSRRQTTAMHRLLQDSRDLLRERPMLGSRAAT